MRCEHELGIADDAERHRHVLVDVGGIERRLDDLGARRHLDAEVGLGERAADAEDQVRLVEERAHRLRDGEAAGAERQRMRLGEGALALEAGGDGDREQLGQLLELGPGFRPVHALAGVDDRPLGGDQHLGGFGDGVEVGAGADALRAARSPWDRHSSPNRSVGISTSTGPPRPELSCWKARRMTFGISLAAGDRLGRLGDASASRPRHCSCARPRRCGAHSPSA